MRKQIIFFLCLFSISLGAQSIKDRVFQSFGLSLEYALLPAFPFIDSYGFKEYTQLDYLGVTGDYKFRFNLFELTENISFSIAAKPSLSLLPGTFSHSYLDNHANLYLGGDLGVEVGLHLWAGSTYQSEKDKGISIYYGINTKLIGIRPKESVDNSTKPKKIYKYSYLGLSALFWAPRRTFLIDFFWELGIFRTKIDPMISNHFVIEEPSLLKAGFKVFIN